MFSPEFTHHVGQIRDFEQLMVPAGATPWVEDYRKPVHPVDVVLYLGCNILRTAHLAPDAITALSRPVWETHGLSEEQARELAARYFVPRKG